MPKTARERAGDDRPCETSYRLHNRSSRPARPREVQPEFRAGQNTRFIRLRRYPGYGISAWSMGAMVAKKIYARCVRLPHTLLQRPRGS